MIVDKEAAKLQRVKNMKAYFRVLAFLPYFYFVLYYLNVLLLFLIHKKTPVIHLVGEGEGGIMPLVFAAWGFVPLSIPFYIGGIIYYLIRRTPLDWGGIIIYLVGVILMFLQVFFDPFLARGLGE